jgi:hypothetical protein
VSMTAMVDMMSSVPPVARRASHSVAAMLPPGRARPGA